jgi:L-2-hydroxycarboxylate dehydrogenase (NAD+)
MSGDSICFVPFDILEKFMGDVFVGSGVPLEDARICARVLIEADMYGIDSHGVGRFKPIYIDRISDGQMNPVTVIDVIRETETTVVLDANNGMGQVASIRGMEMAMEKARAFGMGMAVVRNSNHFGIAGYYARMAIGKGMIAVVGTNARPSIAPTFGVENMLGTNPLTIGLPTDEEFPFLIDCATSVTQRGKIEMYTRLGKKLPEGWVIGNDGMSRTDPGEVLVDLVKGSAALAPLGGIGEEGAGYKGYGYAAVVEVLSSALSDGAYLKGLLGFDEQMKKIPYSLGHFFIAINIEHFIGIDRFKAIAGTIMRTLRASKKAPGEERIWTAGEKEHDAWLARKDKGAPIYTPEQKILTELRDRFDLKTYRFPFE